jgi:hypothetical protein
MKLPIEYLKKNEWILLGPMGPRPPKEFFNFPILAVDGGGDFCDSCDIWVGDGDSLIRPTNASWKKTYPEKKSQSDLALALHLLTDLQRPRLHLWGFSGGRRDHHLFNIGECLHFLNSNASGRIFFYENNTSPSFLFFPKGESDFLFKGTFSVGSIFPMNLKLQGDCLYQQESPLYFSPLSSLGLSNQAFGEVTITSDAPFFIHLVENP